MAAPVPTAFPAFSPDSHYPRPEPNPSIPGAIPTNTWYQNALVQIPDPERVVEAFPWVYIPHYRNKTGLALIPSFFQNISVIWTDGNLETINTPVPGFHFPGKELKLTRRDDLSLQFKLTRGSGSIKSYLVRGNPFAPFKYQGAKVEIQSDHDTVFQSLQHQSSVKRYDLTVEGSQVYTSTEKLLLSNPSQSKYRSDHLAIYQGLLQSQGLVKTTLVGSEITFEFQGTTFRLNVHTHNLTVTGNPVNNPQGQWSVKNAPGVTFESNNKNYVFKVNTTDPKKPLATASVTSRIQYRVWIYYRGTLNLTLTNGKVVSSSTYSDFLQLVKADGTNYDLYRKGILKRAFLDLFVFGGVGSGAGYRFNFELKDPTKDFLLILPSHYDDYQFQPPQATRIADHPQISLSYGRLGQYQFSPLGIPQFKVFMTNFSPPTDLDFSGFSFGVKEILKARVLKDAPQTTIDVKLNPYSFGQEVATAAQILLLGHKLGIGSQTPLVNLRNRIEAALEQWMTGNNPPDFRLSYESIWGGVIVPADTNHSSNLSAYGNSYYNDHHFHYGYFIYAIWVLARVGSSFPSTYQTEIANLAYDVCNPSFTNFSPRARHKDFYSGHSWATGLPQPIQGAPGYSLQSNRQQESSSEAINCYYSVFLLSQEIGSFSSLAGISAAALKTELDASRNYYQLMGPETRIGPYQETQMAGIGIIEYLGKGFTLDWQMQPDSYPGRSLGVYGIQSIPFTEISFTQVSQAWSNQLSQAQPRYRVDLPLVLGLTDNQYTPLYPPNSPPFNAQKSGGYWGNVGLMMLAPGSYPNDQLVQAWNNLLQKEQNSTQRVIKHFDSFSNTLYWLLRHNIFQIEGPKDPQPPLDLKIVLEVAGVKVIVTYQDEEAQVVLIESDSCSKCHYRQVFRFDLVPLLKLDNSLTLREKATHFGVTPEQILRYVAIKLTLVYLSQIILPPEKVLAEKRCEWVLKRIECSHLCRFLSLLSPSLCSLFR